MELFNLKLLKNHVDGSVVCCCDLVRFRHNNYLVSFRKNILLCV